MGSFLGAVEKIDHWMFYKLNHVGIEFFDPFFLFITDYHKNVWAASLAIAALVFFCWKKFGKRFWRAILFFAITVGVTDAVCYRVVKQLALRERPFQNEAVMEQVRKVGHAHGPSFPSNHAANSFAGAAALSTLFPGGTYFFYTYAGLVAFSRVYLGVHFPLDIFFGALLGLLVAYVIRKVFRIQSNTFTGPKA